LVEQSEDENPEDKEEKIGHHVLYYLADEFHEVLEKFHELNDVHDFENHAEDDVDVGEGEDGFFLDVSVLWIVW
jgi:hypothetical protein